MTVEYNKRVITHEKKYEKRKTVLEVYEEVMASAQYLRNNSTEELGKAVSQELYWVAGLLEQTAEVNPPKD